MVAAVQSSGSPQSRRFDLKAAQGKVVRPPPRLIVYGEPKIGKTSFAASAPGVVLVPTEDGSLGVDVPRLPVRGKCESFGDVLEALRVLVTGEHNFQWVAIDTLNGVSQLCDEMVCERDFGGRWNSIPGKEGFNAYGKGEKASAQELRAFLVLLDRLTQERGIGVILLAHAGLHKQGNALGADFQKFGAQVSKEAWALVSGWSDQIGHACREIRATTRENERKAKADAVNAERWLSFDGGPGRDAGSRVGYEMPTKILLSWDAYAEASGADKVPLLVDQAMELAARADDEVKENLKKRFGGEVTRDGLAAIGKQKLEVMCNWLLSREQQQGGV